MSERVPRAARWVLAVAARLVPADRRGAWRAQWTAELEHLCTPSASTSASATGPVRFALGSLRHAWYLRRKEATMGGWLADVRFSARALLRRPGFCAATITTLAVGIGAATAIFSLTEAMLLRPLPMDGSDQLVRIYSANVAHGLERFSVSYPDFLDVAGRDDLFESATFYASQERDVSGDGDPERIRSVAVHDGFFQTLRSRVVLGRTFGADDHDPRNDPTAILSETFWVSRFGSDENLVGRTIRLDGVPHNVVGVVADANGWPAGTQVWTPLQWGGTVPSYADARTNHSWQVVARMRPGVEVEQASDQVAAMARVAYELPGVDERDRDTEALAVPLHSSDGGDGAGALFGTLGAAVALVLLLACMNASALMLTRAWSRARELSLRAALGAGRTRLVVILLGESGVLAMCGGAVGVLLGHEALRRAFAMAPPSITDLAEVRMNLPVVVVGLGLSLTSALLAGLIPAVRASRLSMADGLRDGSGQIGSGWGVTRLRRVLVVGEVAMSLTLLVGAGLTIRGFQRQLRSDPGFEPSNLVSFTVRLPGARYSDPALVDAYYREAIARLEAHPGIVGATSTSRLPLGAGGLSLGRSFIFDGMPEPPEGETYSAAWIEVDPAYFETLGIRAAAGRVFTEDDQADAPLVAIVSEGMAHEMSPSAPMVGRVLRSYYDENLPRNVVGVIPDIQMNGVARAHPFASILVPRAQSVRASMAFLVRTSGDAAPMFPAIRQVMTSLDSDVALDALQPLEEAHQADLGGIRFLTTLFGAFGLLAFMLAVSGVYGLVAYSVSQRTREIGVRLAMGATTGSVRAAVIRESATLAAIGLVGGLALAYAAGRALAAGMDGIAVVEASTYASVAAVLGVVVLAASWIPASRAARVDPVEALRAE